MFRTSRGNLRIGAPIPEYCIRSEGPNDGADTLGNAGRVRILLVARRLDRARHGPVHLPCGGDMAPEPQTLHIERERWCEDNQPGGEAICGLRQDARRDAVWFAL